MSTSNLLTGTGQLFFIYDVSGTNTELKGIFSKEDGVSYDGKSVEAINISVQGDTVSSFIPSDFATFGAVSASAFVSKSTDLDAIVGKQGLLVWSTDGLADGQSFPTTPADMIEANYVAAMNSGKSGNAILTAAPVTGSNNAAQKASLTFTWCGDVSNK